MPLPGRLAAADGLCLASCVARLPQGFPDPPPAGAVDSASVPDPEAAGQPAVAQAPG